MTPRKGPELKPPAKAGEERGPVELYEYLRDINRGDGSILSGAVDEVGVACLSARKTSKSPGAGAFRFLVKKRPKSFKKREEGKDGTGSH